MSSTSSPAPPSGPARSRASRAGRSRRRCRPQSMELMARMGVGILVIAQKPWETAEAELADYRERYLELNGFEAPKPILVLVVGVSHDRDEAQRMREVYLQRWARSTVEHYEFDNLGFAEIEGYEYYGALASNIAKHGLENDSTASSPTCRCGARPMRSPRSCSTTPAAATPAPWSSLSPSAACPPTRRAANFDLFAAEVLPELQRHDVGGDIGVTYGVTPAEVS